MKELIIGVSFGELQFGGILISVNLNNHLNIEHLPNTSLSVNQLTEYCLFKSKELTIRHGLAFCKTLSVYTQTAQKRTTTPIIE